MTSKLPDWAWPPKTKAPFTWTVRQSAHGRWQSVSRATEHGVPKHVGWHNTVDDAIRFVYLADPKAVIQFIERPLTWRKRVHWFFVGMREFRLTCTANPGQYIVAYDMGRELAHLCTFRYWEQS